MNLALQLFRTQNRFLSLVDPKSALNRATNLFFTPIRHDPKPWEEEAEAQGNRIRLKNGVSAIVWGQGPPILMMHGWEGRATQMAGFIEPLTTNGFQVIALDAPAHGRSQGQQSHPMRFVESLFLAQQTFGTFYAVVGHSMGGGCSLYSALEGLQVEKVISISGPANFQNLSKRFARFIGMSKSVVEKFVDSVEETVGIPFEDIDLLSRGKELQQPTLLVHDSDDEEVPFSDAQNLIEVIPNGRFFATSGLGHRKIMRNSTVIDNVCNFIRNDNDEHLCKTI
jgi:pimeloyl-ACP methyl ester carboxylesterase